MTILLGWFRLRGLRKCYDKARAEKRDILEREQMALADKLQKTYDKSKVATLKYHCPCGDCNFRHRCLGN